MGCLDFQNAFFREHLFMVLFVLFRNTCFSEHLKVDAFFINQPLYFFSEYLHLKNHPEKGAISFLLP